MRILRLWLTVLRFLLIVINAKSQEVQGKLQRVVEKQMENYMKK